MDYRVPIKQFSEKLFHIHAKDARVDVEAFNEVEHWQRPWNTIRQSFQIQATLIGAVSRYWVRPIRSVCVEVEDRPYERTLAGRQGALRQVPVSFAIS